MAQWSLISLGGQHPGGSPDQRIYSGLEVPISLVIQSVHSPSLSLCLCHSVYFTKYRLPQLIWLFIYFHMFNFHWPYTFPNIDLFLPFLVLLWIRFKGQYFLLKMGWPIISKFQLKLHFGGHSTLWPCDTTSYPLWWGGRGDNPQRCSHHRLVQYCNCVITGGKCCWPNMLWEGQHPVITY